LRWGEVGWGYASSCAAERCWTRIIRTAASWPFTGEWRGEGGGGVCSALLCYPALLEEELQDSCQLPSPVSSRGGGLIIPARCCRWRPCCPAGKCQGRGFYHPSRCYCQWPCLLLAALPGMVGDVRQMLSVWECGACEFNGAEGLLEHSVPQAWALWVACQPQLPSCSVPTGSPCPLPVGHAARGPLATVGQTTASPACMSPRHAVLCTPSPTRYSTCLA
jgi:hypothetical protein